MIKRIQTS